MAFYGPVSVLNPTMLDAKYGIYPTTLRHRGISCISFGSADRALPSESVTALENFRHKFFAVVSPENQSRRSLPTRKGVADCASLGLL
jgi:hypothetical protein